MTDNTDKSQGDIESLLVDMQTRLAFQDQTISELNEVVTDQQRQIDQLELRMKILSDKLDMLEEQVDIGGPVQPQDEKPPHY